MAGATYWIGSNGNLYYGSGATGASVVDAGPASDYFATSSGFTAKQNTGNPYAESLNQGPGGVVATQIDNPGNPGGQTLGANINLSGSGTGKPLNQAGIDATKATIDQIPALLQAALDAEATTHANTIGNFDASQKVQQGQYDEGTITNQKNYDQTFMDSIRAGIKGLGGLMALLRGTGAGGGTAEDLARDAVGATTASDITGGATTQKENQGQLDSSLASFLSDLKQKRTAAEDTYANNQSAIRRDSNTQLQDLFGKIAGFYGDAGDQSNADAWTNKAAALTPDIAANSRTKVSPYDTSPVVVHAPNLTAFNAPTQPSVVAPPSDGQVGTGIFTMDPRKKQSVTTPSLVPVGA